MRILIITAQYHPSMTPNVYRWAAVAEHWAAQGHEVQVLCTHHSAVPEHAVINGVQVHRAGENSLLDWAYNLLGKQKRRAEAGASTARSAGRKWLERLVDLSWRSLYWPDGRCLWYRPGKQKALELIRQYSIEHIISVGLPFTAHRIAAAAKKAFPRVQWLMDIEDPFYPARESRINNRFLYDSLNYRAEKQALAQADAVSVTVGAAKSLYEKIFPEIGKKISIVPPLYSLDHETVVPFRFESPGKVHLAYFGTFYHRIRLPDGLLALLAGVHTLFPQQVDRMQVHFFGEIHPAFLPAFERYPELKDMICLHGLVSRATVAAAAEAADFLINIGNRTAYHLPSKSVDYLMSGKPVINIASRREDTFWEFMQDYPLFLNLYLENDEPGPEQVRALVQFLEAQHGAIVPAEKLGEMAQPYTLAQVANQYLKLLV